MDVSRALQPAAAAAPARAGPAARPQPRGAAAAAAPPPRARRPRAPPLCAADGATGPSESAEELPIEAARRRAARAPKPAAAAAAGKQQPFKVVAPLRDQALGGGPLTEEQVAEGYAVSALALVFALIIGEGVFLAASGFLPEGADAFATDVVYPAFSPTLGVFLAGSSAYGLWKTRSNAAAEEAKNNRL
jgi:hypothetical protein